ncbi:MAG: hypothetical protein HC915_17875 [Anaerolineae bacterium]|nr:hypothetical protein [Anaerolineae bacterium]
MAAFNILNYFVSLDSGTGNCGPLQNVGCRGADTASEFERQHNKIVQAICGLDADILGLIELENTTGVDPLAILLEGGSPHGTALQGVNDVCGGSQPYTT